MPSSKKRVGGAAYGTQLLKLMLSVPYLAPERVPRVKEGFSGMGLAVDCPPLVFIRCPQLAPERVPRVG